jgi:transcriptional regulator with XRE-family HTH domain
MDINAKIASRIKALRNEKGYKAESVAQKLELSKAAYSQLENGKIDITMTKLQKIADYFSIPIASILQENSGATFNIDKVENSTINGTQINNYTVSNNFDREWNAEEWLIHRNVSLSLYSEDYLTLYKSLLPANLPSDYSDYNFLSFTAQGNGLLELGLVKSSIQEWKHQYRANIVTRSFDQTYYVPFDYFRSTGSNTTINPNDLSTLTFTLLPDQMGQNDLTLNIRDVKFTKNAPQGYEELLVTMQDSFIAYPNPSKGEVNTVVYSNTASKASLNLFDVTGKLVYSTVIDLDEGRNELSFDFANEAHGMMFLSIANENVNYGTVKMIFK